MSACVLNFNHRYFAAGWLGAGTAISQAEWSAGNMPMHRDRSPGRGGEGSMRRFRWVRRGAIAVVIVVALLNLGGVQFVRNAYPADPFKAEALAKCIAADPGFVRFFPYERSRCYAR